MTVRHSVIGLFAVLALSCNQGQRGPAATGEIRSHVAAPDEREAPATKATVAMAAKPPAAAPAGTGMAGHVVFRPEEVKWADGPPSLPAGAKFAVLEGDPSSQGFFVMRLTLPANYRIPPHWHPTLERITVLSGTMHLGMGERFDPGGGQALPAGTYATMPRGMRHFAWTDGPTVIQLGTLGPWGITYVNPADDPRQQKK